jgi:hypothetical protein
VIEPGAAVLQQQVQESTVLGQDVRLWLKLVEK